MKGEAINRIRWRCRRGLLELDLILARFLDRHADGLCERDGETLLALLEYPDTDLWEMIRQNRAGDDGDVSRILQMLREC